jgi:hypothetical protein
MKLQLPRFVICKRLASGKSAFYFNVPLLYRERGCPVPNEPLGTDYIAACGADGVGGRAATLNAHFDEWRKRRAGEPLAPISKFGTVDWLFREFKASKAYQERVSQRTRPDYERIMLLVADYKTKRGDRIGDRKVKAITPVSADKLYELLCEGPKGKRPRQGEKVIAVCRRAWKVVRRLYPDQFDKDLPNPWEGVTKAKRNLKTKDAVDRDQVYAFARRALELDEPEAAAAAVICFEFLQRPENVLAGYLTWTDYRAKEHPNAIKIIHHKTGAVVWHPLEETTKEGTIKFYAEAEAIISHLPKRGVPMILKAKRDGGSEPFTAMIMARRVRRVRNALPEPYPFTLDACRHGGMTELEEAQLTDGQGRALSGHRTQRAYEGYAKRNLARALPATRKRYAHTLANQAATSIQNEQRFGFQNDEDENDTGIA